MSQDRTSSSGTIPTTLTPFDADEALRRAHAATVVRPARRTLAEMAPGYQRQPLLRLVPPTAASNEAPCLFCDSWFCPGNCQQFAPAPTSETAVAA